MSNRMDSNFKKYGYARVSNKSQEANSSRESQKQQLVRNDILESNITIEVGSATNEIKNRPNFQNLIRNVLKEGDTLVVTKIDRCSRNTLEFLKLQEKLFNKFFRFIALNLTYFNGRAVNKLIATNLAAIAIFENEQKR